MKRLNLLQLILLLRNLLLGAIICLACTLEGQAGLVLTSQEQLQFSGTVSLPFIAGRVLFQPGSGNFVVSSANDVSRETATIVGYNANDASKIFQFYVLHSVDAMAFSGDGEWLFLVGGKDKEGFASRVRVSNAVDGRPSEVVTIRLSKLPVQPSIALDRAQTLYIGDATSDRLIAIGTSLFDRAVFDAGEFESQFFSWARGVHALAISESLNLAFVSNERLPKISTLRLGGATEMIDELWPVWRQRRSF